MFVPCSVCHAEVSADREKCPHCGGALGLTADQAVEKENEELRAKIKEAREGENAKLKKELSDLNAAKQVQ